MAVDDDKLAHSVDEEDYYIREERFWDRWRERTDYNAILMGEYLERQRREEDV